MRRFSAPIEVLYVGFDALCSRHPAVADHAFAAVDELAGLDEGSEARKLAFGLYAFSRITGQARFDAGAHHNLRRTLILAAPADHLGELGSIGLHRHPAQVRI